MDTLELMSGVRNLTRLHTEHSLPTRILLRHMNTGYFESIIPALSDHIRDKVFAESELTDQDGDTVSKPANCDKIIDVMRGEYPCIEVARENKYKIGQYRRRSTILMYPDDDSEHPLYIDEGANIRLYPTLDETDVTISYKKKIPPLLYCKATAASTSLTLDNNAYPNDDFYNNQYFHLYTESNLVITLSSILYASDYVGSTRVATLSAAPGNGTYQVAMVPIVPEIFHPFIQDTTIIQLAKAGIYDADVDKLKAAFIYDIQDAQNRYIRS